MKNLESDWEDLQHFLMWKYSNQHMKISDSDAAHCETYALGGNYDNEHVGVCAHFTILMNFFDMPLESFLN